MYRISNFQIYCLLLIALAPVAFLEVPKRLIVMAYNNAWLVIIATLLPGILIIMMFNYIIRKSPNPFPLLLEDYFGKIIGKFLAFTYIFVFLFIASFTLSIFVNFIETNVLPGVPVSVLIGSFLFVGYVILKSGLENFARLSEIIVFIGLPFSFIILFLATFHTIDLGNILPIGRTNIGNFGLGLASSVSIIGRLFPILTLVYFSNDRPRVRKVVYPVLATYLILILTAVLVTILVFGGIAASILAFPVFSLVKLIKIGDFFTNIDILFIGIWVSGVVGALTIFWFMACFTTQQLFKLRDFCFLAGPTSLIIAIGAFLAGPNIVVLSIINEKLLVAIYLIFFIFIPLIIFIISLFRSDQPMESTNDNSTSNNVNKVNNYSLN